MAATDRRHFRAVWSLVVFGIFYGFILLLVAGAALNPDVPAVGRAACAGLSALIGWRAWIAWRGGVEVDDERVTVRQWRGRSVSVPWRDVKGFALVGNGKGGAWIAVRTIDGRTLKTQGLAANSTRSKWGQEIVSQLEASRPKS